MTLNEEQELDIKELIKEYIKENLTMRIDETREMSGDYVEITLFIDGEEICEERFEVYNEDR